MKALIPLLATITSVSAGLPEVDLVFYGRVLHMGGGRPYVMTEGELSWEIVEDGEQVFAAKAELSPLKQGEMSYQIRVPQHLAIAETLTKVLPGLPLSALGEETAFENTQIMLDGLPLRLADSAAVSMSLASSKRGGFQRLDLIYEGGLPDGDSDGLPDWWEDEYGTNRNVADGEEDSDEDGVSNLAEYLAGTLPNGSDQIPQLISEYLLQLPIGGKAVPVITAIDSDSLSEDLIYQIAGLPSTIEVRLLGEEDAVSTFTQADLDEGKVYLNHLGVEAAEFAAVLSLRDETPGHPATESSLRILVREEEELWEGWKLTEISLPDEFPAVQDGSLQSGGVILRAPSGVSSWDGESSEAFSDEFSRLFLGAGNQDVMLGSSEGDYFVIGAGDRVQPGGGADSILMKEEGGMLTVRGFEPVEGDVLNLTRILDPIEGRMLENYLRLNGQFLEIDANGDGSGFTDASVLFEDSSLPATVADLWDSGSLQTGVIVPETTLYLAYEGILSEEGLQAATLSFRRRGDASEALQVPLSYGGTAAMGLDYGSLPSSLIFPEGQKVVTLVVSPFADDELEPAETLQVQMGSGDWLFGEGGATVTLELLDLPSRVWLEVAERVAVKGVGSSAQILVRRSGPMSAPLTVRLNVTGSATPFLDYARIAPTVTFLPAQSVITLDVEPLAFGLLTYGAETVKIAVTPDASYQFGEITAATVLIVEEPASVAQWMSEYRVSESQSAFLTLDSDGDGLNGLAEFAFGGNPGIPDSEMAYPVLVREESGVVHVSYRRHVFAPELSYRLESSVDFESWQKVPTEAESSSEILSDGMERVTMTISGSSDGSCFFRVVVE